MAARRVFLRRVLQLATGGLYSGLLGACVTGQPQSGAVVASGASSAANANGAAPLPTDPKAPLPPPDLFDAALLDADFWLKPRSIELYRPQNGEHLAVLYWKDGQIIPDAYERICHNLRDVQAGETVPIDPKLIETLWACQAFCARYGIHHPLHILSGYRTEATNRKLVEIGVPAARKSLHIDGKAADIRIVDLNTEVLGGLVRSFERGGVGFYFRPGTTGGWIHTDTGVSRTWHG